MTRRFEAALLIFTIVKVRSREPELPLCPTNMAFFPQTLPMHCRMPSGGVYQSGPDAKKPTLPPFPEEFYQSPAPEKVPRPIPFPINPGMPGFPGLPPGLPPGMPGPGPMPMPVPMPMPMPAGPAHKLPVIVMPFYSPDPSYKKRQSGVGSDKYPSDSDNRILEIHTRRPRYYNSDIDRRVEIHTRRPRRNRHRYDSSSDDEYSDTSGDTSSEGQGWWNPRRKNRRSGRRMSRKPHKAKRRRHNVLTPVLQYVTKDGYVIFEKKITKDEAKDWLSVKKEKVETTTTEEPLELMDEQNVDKEDDVREADELDREVEILDAQRDKKSKEHLEAQTRRAHKTPKKRSHRHGIRKNRAKERKKEASS